MELTSESPFEDRDSPHLSIRPLLCKAKPGMERIRASRRTLGQYMTSVRALHKEQCHKNGSIPSKEILAGRRITNILQDYENVYVIEHVGVCHADLRCIFDVKILTFAFFCNACSLA